MNRPPEDFVLVNEERLLNFSTACFEKAGLTNEHAALISRLLVNSDLRGVRSHGTRTVNRYCRGFESGGLNPNPNIRVIHETPTAVVLDGNGTLGYLPMVRATEHAIAKAKEVGIGMGLVRYIGHYGSAGTLCTYVQRSRLHRFFGTGIPEPRQCWKPRSETAARLFRQPADMFRYPLR